MTVVGWTSAVKQSHCVSDDGYLLNVTHEHTAKRDKKGVRREKETKNRISENEEKSS